MTNELYYNRLNSSDNTISKMNSPYNDFSGDPNKPVDLRSINEIFPLKEVPSAYSEEIASPFIEAQCVGIYLGDSNHWSVEFKAHWIYPKVVALTSEENIPWSFEIETSTIKQRDKYKLGGVYRLNLTEVSL